LGWVEVFAVIAGFVTEPSHWQLISAIDDLIPGKVAEFDHS
jgi:hypothetical protein